MDLTRATLHVLLPLSAILAVVLVWQGVPQTLSHEARFALRDPPRTGQGEVVAEQVVALGPVASQIAIKQLGTNGGGFYNVNSAHPFENPTPLSNFLEALAILAHPRRALLHLRRHGEGPAAGLDDLRRDAGHPPAAHPRAPSPPSSAATPPSTALGADQSESALQPGGNMEGKEARIGPASSAIWAAATTAASNGSVNSMHDSFTPLGGLVPMWLIQLGEVVFGGVGSGLYGMLLFAIVAVFIAGLMVGRTPEYLGQEDRGLRREDGELAILVPPALVLVGTALACAVPSAFAGVANPGAHGFSEMLYAMTSMRRTTTARPSPASRPRTRSGRWWAGS